MTAAQLLSNQGKKDEGEGGTPSQGNLGDRGPSFGLGVNSRRCFCCQEQLLWRIFFFFKWKLSRRDRLVSGFYRVVVVVAAFLPHFKFSLANRLLSIAMDSCQLENKVILYLYYELARTTHIGGILSAFS